jgi:GNAT superfamily N-acetyltransferase
MRLTFEFASVAEAGALAALHAAVADHLTSIHGQGPWSSRNSQEGVLATIRTSTVFVARQGVELVATLRLATNKPSAIDPSYFTACRKPLYLHDVAVLPARQRQGIGRRCLEEAQEAARTWAADAIRLDAYAAAGGAGDFYSRCGYTEVGRASYRNTQLIYYQLLL